MTGRLHWRARGLHRRAGRLGHGPVPSASRRSGWRNGALPEANMPGRLRDRYDHPKSNEANLPDDANASCRVLNAVVGFLLNAPAAGAILVDGRSGNPSAALLEIVNLAANGQPPFPSLRLFR
jgi:hypothetical protein